MMRMGLTTGEAIRHKRLPYLLCLLLLAGIAGCAHEQAYNRGMDLARQGQYERAVAELENAIRLAEEQHKSDAATRYRASLEDVKQAAGQFYYGQAQRQFEQADLAAAQVSIDRSIAYAPQEPSYPALRQRITGAIATAEAIRAEALSLAEQRQWRPAVERMGEALRMHRTLPGGDAELKSIRQRAYQYYLARAQEKLVGNDLDGAEAEAQSALSYVDSGREAQALVQNVTNRRQAAALIANGRSLLEQGEPEEALHAFEHANALYPSHAELPALLSRARQAACDHWIAQGRQAVDAGQYPTALRLFQKSRDMLRDYGSVDALIASTRSRLATVHLDASRQCLQDGASGCAAFQAAVALGYQPSSPEAQRQLELSLARVRQDIYYTIEFDGFEAPPEHPGVAGILSSAAMEHLSHIQSANIGIVIRTDSQMVPDEPRPGRASLLGQVLDCQVAADTRHTGDGESVYQDGFRREPNPEHAKAAAAAEAAMKDLEQVRHRLADAEAELARVEHADRNDREAMARKRKAEAAVSEAKKRLAAAATKVGIAQGRLAATPRDVLVPNMVHYRFPIQTMTWTAHVTIMVRMVDLDTGELILADRIDGQSAYSDRFVAADPARNVPEDPLVLPQTERLLEAAAGSITGKLRQSISAACEKHGQRFVIQMQRARDAGDTMHAADFSMKYLFAYPTGNAETSRMINFLHTYLGDEDTLVDMQNLLRTHCRVMR
jgi:tetratricopeptide (TPR) repeat protein